MANIWDGIIIGICGGAGAGVGIWLVKLLGDLIIRSIEKRRVYSWIKKNTSPKPGEQFRSTRAIASHNNLTQDRTRYICSIHKNIHLSTGPKTDDVWSVYYKSSRD